MRFISQIVQEEIIEQRVTTHNGCLQRRSTMDQILRINRSATADFLDRFSDKALRMYLDHLEATLAPRGRNAIWTRPGDTAALNALEPAW